ncbi:EpsG family protein [Algibacter lectus]|uniref:EpsG family protein n=1 Tax=Algibacter lectus TaxID=221126 RepID=UPI002494405D|nr:EpsG family protein [Algibacter lectus]
MIEFIPLKYYYDIFTYTCLVIVLITFLHSFILDMHATKNIAYIKTIGLIILVLIVLYIGLRPVSGRYFTDMRTYARHFNHYKNGGIILIDKDIFFHLFMKTCASIMSVNNFFLVCATLYIYPMYKVSKAFFKEFWFYCFLMFIVSFSFWAYGVNGIRNGIATSFFLWGISYQNNKIKMISLFVLAVLFHKSMLLVILAYSATVIYNNPKTFLSFWLATIPLSIALGGVWISLFTSLGFADDRLSGYLSGESAGGGGFRYDFLFYSAFPVFAGWYFIFKRKFDDKVYKQLFNTYLITNGFWILVIRANFSNRFAYLSWFMMAIVIIYPLLKQNFFKRQHIMLGYIYLAYFAFTYLMYLIYYADDRV